VYFFLLKNRTHVPIIFLGGDILNFPHYTTTALEDWVTNLYKRLNMLDSKELKPSSLARYFNIYIKQFPLPSRFDVFGRYKAVLVDSREPIEIQREQFYHELCHILRHVGHQTMMPEAFFELQERDAKHFTRYAALPYHIITKYDYHDPNIIQTLAEDFSVSESLCLERLLQIERRSKQYSTKHVTERKLFY